MDRVQSLLKREISSIIQKEYNFNLGLISIIHVKCSPDLSSATVFYSHLAEKKEQQKTFKKLQSSRPFIKRNLGKLTNLKRIPNINFRLDDSLEKGNEIVNQIQSLNQ